MELIKGHVFFIVMKLSKPKGVLLMRSAKEAGNFPYDANTVCYFEVDGSGNVSQLYHKNKSDKPGILQAYQRVMNKETTLYAVWPGKWSSDLFSIDDLDAFAKAFDFM